MMQMVGCFAEFERAMIRERTSVGLAIARAEGRVGGRPKKAMQMALAVYPEAKVKVDENGLVLFPSPAAIPRGEARRLQLG